MGNDYQIKGPWIMGKRGATGYDDIRVSDADGIIIADVMGHGGDWVVHRARLIAAAPELLEELKRAERLLRMEGYQPSQSMISAIAKAEGRE